MTKREVIRTVLEGKRPPYVPWSFSFTLEAREKLIAHYGHDDIVTATESHIPWLGDNNLYFDYIGDDCVRDPFGVVWDRSVDKDIGIVKRYVLHEPTLKGFTFPDPVNPRFFSTIQESIARWGDRFRVYAIGFSLFERAWTLRGMENLLMDFHDHPAFVHEFLEAIADYNIAQIHEALKYDIDAIYFGDDWGQQHGLLMGPVLWREFIRPVLARMYGEVRRAGKFVIIHSCGDVDELFDDLIEIGLSCFNPFQPEVMDVAEIIQRYRGRLSFFGGVSTQRTLPYGSPEDVRKEVRRLIGLGSGGGYIISPAHAVEGDVPLENMLALINEVQKQEYFTPQR